MNVEDLMSGYYSNDFSGKELKTYEIREVLPFEMKSGITEVSKRFSNIKTGFTCDKLPDGRLNLRTRRYFILYKK